MDFNDVFADLKVIGNVAVTQAAVKHGQQLLLPFGEFFRNGGAVGVVGGVRGRTSLMT